MADQGMVHLPPVRRIVTGLNAQGRAVVTMDGAAPNHQVRPHGTASTLLWGSDATPADIVSDEDFGARDNVVQPPRSGSWFRIVDFPPGAPGRMHRTDSIDYVVCMSGEIDMEMDDGLTLRMKAGDVMVQQGTNHSWINRSDTVCRIAFVLVDAKTASGDGFEGPGAQQPTSLVPPPEGTKPMLPPVRRIVTTHDHAGRAIVMNDGPAPSRVFRARGNVSTLIWGTDETPAEIWSAEDFGTRENEIEPPPRGSWFRIIDYPPGLPGRMHRTDSIDYAICMAGEIDMELDDGATVHMNEGDVMVQRGVNHSWINSSAEPCRIAFMLLDARQT